MGVIATETRVFAAKTPINDAGSTQRKEKKRKDSSLHSESMSDSRPTNKSELIEDYDAFVAYFNESVAGTAIQRIRGHQCASQASFGCTLQGIWEGVC